MFTVATKQNDDGTYNNVGMNTRTVAPAYQQRWRMLKWCAEFGQGKTVRLEYFHNKYDQEPFRTEFIEQPKSDYVPPRLGAASLAVSFSDKDGLKVVHGSTDEVLMHIAPENLIHGDWDRVWEGLHKIETDAYLRWRDANPSIPIAEYLATNPKNR